MPSTPFGIGVRVLILGAIGMLGASLLRQCSAGGGAGACLELRNPTTQLAIGPHRLTVEVVGQEVARRCGLAYRPALPQDHGMLFVYREEQQLAFWMRDTQMPLSLAYADRHGVIRQIVDMSPHAPQHQHRSAGPAMYALETRRGWFGERGIESGARMDFALPPHLVVE